MVRLIDRQLALVSRHTTLKRKAKKRHKSLILICRCKRYAHYECIDTCRNKKKRKISQNHHNYVTILVKRLCRPIVDMLLVNIISSYVSDYMFYKDNLIDLNEPR